MLPPEPALPVRAVLGDVVATLRDGGAAVLVAPPGAGKTTLVPLALADAMAGRILVAEPRRIAARAAAARMAALTGGRVGEAIGYAVRGDRRVSAATRVEVVTTGILLRRLQRDPDLPGVAAVMLDECHERHVDTDLALAFTLDVRESLRADLALLATSATADADRLAARVGAGTPVVVAPDALYPTEIVWAPPAGRVAPAYGMAVDPKLLDHVAATVRRALGEADGDVLVFLPGGWEINAVAGRLADRPSGVDLLTLHGRQPAAVQDAALAPGSRRRIVLATGVAESSLTVPGVRIVVDAGLSREPRTDHARGLGSLVTVASSRATATQRAGRAGREGPGRVYRCWPEAESRPAHAQPEIAVADLASFALELAAWGHPGGDGLALLDPPPAAALNAARETLAGIGAVDADGRITARGRAIAEVGAHPRLARALIDGAALVGAARAAQVVALLSDDGGSVAGDDLVAAWRRLRDGADRGATARWREETRRLSTAGERATVAAGESRDRAGSAHGPGESARPAREAVPDDLAAGLVVALAFPERLARARSAGSRTYLMAGGTAAELPAGSALPGVPWLAVAVADRSAGQVAARIRLAAAIDEATARQAGASLLATADEVAWVDGDVVARRVTRLGAIVLSDARLARPDAASVAAAVADGLRAEGLDVLTWTPAAVALRRRLAFCRRVFGDPWPAVDDESLRGRTDWLDLTGVRRRADLARIDVAAALRGLLDRPLAARLDELAPERIAVPSGSMIRVDYTDPAAPVLAVKIQEAFGWPEAPVVAGGRVTVVLHLTSPAGRPAAVTSDLRSFWANTYPQVRKELRARYPRHPWPEDPASAVPTRKLQPRRAGG